MTSEDVVRRYVDATSAGDGDAAAALTADDVVIVLPNDTELRGKEGVRQFAAKHAETDGKKQSVALTSLDALGGDRFVATPGLSFARRGCCRSAADRTLRDFSRGALLPVRGIASALAHVRPARHLR